jgi:hypothetical protein
LDLLTWLAEWNVTHVAMESTGVYWLPIYNLLEEHFQVWLVNAGHVKQVPGRKTDVTDAQWLAQLLQHGLLKPCCIPDQAQRDLREIVRYRQTQVEERQRVANRIQKVLEDANIKLAAVATDIQGVSAQAMLRALLDGEEDPAVLADLAQARRFRKELQRVAKALSPVRDADVFLEHLGQYVEHVADEDRSGMAVLSGTLQRERVEARYELLAFLESERYADFKREFAAFLVGDPVGWDMTPRVRDLVGGMLWRRYEKLRAYELHITFEGELDDQQEDALHQMRIAGKHLRYVLDTFSGTFADHADQCIEPLKELQDHLDETFDQMPFCVPVPINSRLAPSDWDGAE